MTDIVLSSRVRLARNINGYPFFLKDERAVLLAKTVSDSLKKIDRFNLYRMSAFEDATAVAMMERHLVSADLIKNRRFGAVVISEDENVSIMLNEEDHIREQCILKGLSLKDAYDRLILIDRALSGEMQFAFSPTYGYLTSCLTNLGTGLRASVMMFLPALTLTKSLEDCLNGVARLNMAVRGVYGEGSDSSGYIYQISNQRTLGITESEIILAVESAAGHIAQAEIRARDFLIKTAPIETKDRILRSYGILTNCYRLSHGEFVNLIAFIKLGIHYGLLENSDPAVLDELITDMGPANICRDIAGMSAPERDALRAERVVKELRRIVRVIEGNLL